MVIQNPSSILSLRRRRNFRYGDDAIMAPRSQYGVDAFAYWPNFGIAGWAGGVIILFMMMSMSRGK